VLKPLRVAAAEVQRASGIRLVGGMRRHPRCTAEGGAPFRVAELDSGEGGQLSAERRSVRGCEAQLQGLMRLEAL